ncbi:MAG TPA: cupredoxin domain-containing protein [Bdellovibrionales bacterium]|nr:cupredoxin domain-containing protein [Bdellovibrionales bacterium]
MNRVASFLSLFTSMGTLICCALPALLVSLGLGAVMAGLASNVPGLIWMSENKTGFFIAAAAMLALNGIWLWTNRNAPCPIDPKLRDACMSGRKTSKVLYFISLTVFSIGTFFAYGTALAASTANAQTIAIEVTKEGFVPSTIDVRPGTDVTLKITRKTDESCSTEIHVPSKNIKHDLPLNEVVTVALGKLDKGEIRFGCGMNLMEGGKIFVR